MAYDRYVAICNPLQYPLIVTKSICVLLASTSWLIAIFNSFIFAWLVSNLLFYSSQEVNHFFCEMKSVLVHSRSDTETIRVAIFWESLILGFIPFILILISYLYIISAILNIHTSAGRLKIFSSCSSHLTIVVLFCGTTISFYVSPETENSQEQKKFLSLLYTALVPMLNPLVYSLRNQDVGRAIRTFFQM
ncbi:olfactory receptor 2A12-like [Xenopus tropicalis]|uniref:Olfactory receptor 2A12-like n=1 Tax=Xenopus tropicalis TaxID=8364 RepID=A0A8J1J891_XENTR|nr:olfactory receptor 2A12-like [Xenopus tropicalis]